MKEQLKERLQRAKNQGSEQQKEIEAWHSQQGKETTKLMLAASYNGRWRKKCLKSGKEKKIKDDVDSFIDVATIDNWMLTIDEIAPQRIPLQLDEGGSVHFELNGVWHIGTLGRATKSFQELRWNDGVVWRRSKGHTRDIEGVWTYTSATNGPVTVKIEGDTATWPHGEKANFISDSRGLTLQFEGQSEKYHATVRPEDGALCWSDGALWTRIALSESKPVGLKPDIREIQGVWTYTSVTKGPVTVEIEGNAVTWLQGERANITCKGKELVLQFEGQTKKYYATIRPLDSALCWSDGAIWTRLSTGACSDAVSDQGSV